MAAPSRARRPLPLRRISSGAIRTTSSSSSGTKLKAKSFWVLEWKSGVVETMITPSSDQRDEVEHGLRDQGAEQDREGLAHAAGAAGEGQRAGRLAEAGRQGRRHQHADHRRRGDVAAADRAGWAAPRATIQYQEAARKKSESAISAQAISTQVRSERTMLSTTLSTPIFCAASAVRPTPRTPATPRPTRRATRRLRLPLWAERRVERGQPLRRAPAGRRRRAAGPPSAAARSAGAGRLGRLDRPLVDLGHLVGDARPGVALGALRGRPRPSPRRRSGSWWARCSSSARRCGSPGGTRTPSTPSVTTSL